VGLVRLLIDKGADVKALDLVSLVHMERTQGSLELTFVVRHS
jgi:hypothetical protein